MANRRLNIKTKKAHSELFSLMPAYEIVLTSWAFTQSYNIYIKGIERTLDRVHLTNSQWTALLVLFASKKPMTVAEINRFLPMETPSVSALLDRLEQRELIKRRRSSRDRRTVNVSITEKGFKLLRKIIPNLSEFVESVFKPLTTEERELLVSLSKRIRNSSLMFYGLTTAKADTFLEEITRTITNP